MMMINDDEGECVFEYWVISVMIMRQLRRDNEGDSEDIQHKK